MQTGPYVHCDFDTSDMRINAYRLDSIDLLSSMTIDCFVGILIMLLLGILIIILIMFDFNLQSNIFDFVYICSCCMQVVADNLLLHVDEIQYEKPRFIRGTLLNTTYSVKQFQSRLSCFRCILLNLYQSFI